MLINRFLTVAAPRTCVTYQSEPRPSGRDPRNQNERNQGLRT